MDPNEKQLVQTMIDDAVNKAAGFSTRKLGDTPTDANQLTPKDYVDGIASVLNASIVGLQTSVAGIATSILGISTNIFGDGSDGAGVADGSTSIAGVAPIASVYTLTRDVFFTNLTISTGVTVNPAGYEIWGTGTLTINGTGKISRNGNNASGPTGGAALAAGTLPGALAGSGGGGGGAGFSGAGSGGGGNPGAVGASGVGTTNSIGSSSTNNDNYVTNTGKGGPTTNFPTAPLGAIGGNLGTATAATRPPRILQNYWQVADMTLPFTAYQGSASAPGGGGGGGGNADTFNTFTVGGNGGSGGGAGGTGGFIAIYFKTIVNNSMGGISANGGNAADGATGTVGTSTNTLGAGGGGGGTGGNGGTGGVIMLVYKTLTQNGTFTVSAGSLGGAGLGASGAGNGGQFGLNGTLGKAGVAGSIWQYQV